MPTIAVVANASLSATWGEILCSDGHEVETYSNVFECAPLFGRDRLDILIIDVENPNFGEAMLIPQCRAKWPDCKIIATVPGYTFHSSAVFRMGLWAPDQVLIQPVPPNVLRATVDYLWASMRAEKIRTSVTAAPLKVAALPKAKITSLPANAASSAPERSATKGIPAHVPGGAPLPKI